MKAVNLTVCLLCASVMFVLLAGSYAVDAEDNKTEAAVKNILKSNFLMNIFSALETVFPDAVLPAHMFFMTAVWSSLFSELFYFCVYVYSYTRYERTEEKRGLLFANIICAAGMLCVVLFEFLFRPAGRGIWLTGMAGILAMLLPLQATLTVHCSRKELKRDNIIAFSVYVATSMLSLEFQIMFPAVRILNIGLTLSVLFIYVVMAMRRYAVVSEQKAELSETRMKLLQMQMNPHFLSNTMNAIYHLCEQDKDKAMQGIEDLSGFLRNNLDLSAENGLIPFEKELESIRYYFSLEQMKRGDRLKIIEMIEATDFMVPPFSVQVFAENAVVHGFREGVGETVSFVVRKLPGYTEISIIDGGKGFDGDSNAPEGNPGHYGITNAKERLKELLDAEVSIISAKDAGTIVNIRIPEERGGK